MGAFYSSFSIHGVAQEQVAERMRQWLEAKGFEAMASPRLFPLDQTYERGVAVCSTGPWCTVLYSDLGEEERLSFELQKLGRPVLHLWLHDSDVWGFELEEGAELAASYCSDPSFLGGGAAGKAGEVGMEALARLSPLPDFGPRCRRVLQRRTLFKEDLCAAFCTLLGVAPAACSYEYAVAGEWGDASASPVEFLWFRHHDFDPLAGFHLHRVSARCAVADGGVPADLAPAYRRMVSLFGEGAARRAWKGAGDEASRRSGALAGQLAAEGPNAEEGGGGELDPEEAARLRREMELARRRVERQARRQRFLLGCVGVLLRPVGVLLGPLLGWSMKRRMLQQHGAFVGPETGVAPTGTHMREENGWVVNDLHGCRCRLPSEGRIPPRRAHVFLHNPVLALRLSGVDMWWSAQRPESVRWLLGSWPKGAELEEENLEIGGRPAKLVRGRIGAGARSVVRRLAMVQAPEGVYVMHCECNGALDAVVEPGFRSAAESFEIGPVSDLSRP